MDVYSNDNDINSVNELKSRCIISSKISSPFFSIIIPTYNRIEPLKQAIESSLNQNTDISYEIVVVDDYPQSTVYEDVIKDLKNDKLSYYINMKNIGQCNNFNKCIQLSRGKYLVLLTDDDVLSPDFLSTVYKTILNLNYPGIIGVNYNAFTDKINFIDEEKEVYYRKITKKSFFFGRYINVTGMTFKKSIAIEIGGFKRKYDPIHDSIFIYNVICNYDGIYLDKVLAGYRIGMNLSLQDDVMIKIVLLINECRKSIAKNEKWAKIWMDFFDAEYFALYVKCANHKWGKNMDIDNLLNKAGYNRKAFSIRYKSMIIALKLVKFFDRIINKKSVL